MHSSTQQFVRAMDAKDIKHSDPETAAGGRETVTVIYSGENIPSIRMRFFFDQDCQDVAIRVFDLVKVPEAKLDVLLKAINASALPSSFWTPTTTASRPSWTPYSAATTWGRSAWS